MVCRYLLVPLVTMPLAAAPAMAAPVDSSELARCHAMPTRDQQLDCYEALTAASSPEASKALVAPNPLPPAAPTASAPGTPISPASAPTAFAPGAPIGSASAAPTAAVPSAGQPAAPFNPDDPANWGLSRPQAAPQPSGASSNPTAIKTTVFQMTEDRLHNVTVVLDNGQTWKFIEPDPRLRPGDPVTLKRASLGSFLLVTPSRRSYRVERSR